MRTFEVTRETDASGISGIGKVMEGVEFSDGKVVTRWVIEGQPNSVVWWDSFKDFLAISITAHPTNVSRITYGDGSVEVYGPNQEPPRS